MDLHAESAFATSAPSMMIEDHTSFGSLGATSDSLHLACILPSDPRLSLKLHQGHRMSTALVDAVSSHWTAPFGNHVVSRLILCATLRRAVAISRDFSGQSLALIVASI